MRMSGCSRTRRRPAASVRGPHLEKTKYYEGLSDGEGSPDAKKYDMLLEQCT